MPGVPCVARGAVAHTTNGEQRDRGTSFDQTYADTVAVDDLTFEVRPGVVTGFLGPEWPENKR